MTDNHNYDEPTLGSTSGWGSQLNSNFRDLDTDVEIRDTDANKGNYTPKDGALYRATDTGAIYQGNGTSWVLADMEVDSFSAGEATTETLVYDYSQNYPHNPRMPEGIGNISIRPYPGISNPVIDESDVSAVESYTKIGNIADQFAIYKDGFYYLIFEVLYNGGSNVVISYAKSPDPTFSGSGVYQTTILDDGNTGSTKLSYPNTLQVNGDVYIIPNHGGEGNSNTAYRATSWPPSGTSDLEVAGSTRGGETAYWHDGTRWWVIEDSDLKYSETVDDTTPPIDLSWTAHPSNSSFFSESEYSSPAGRPMHFGDHIRIPVKDGTDGGYGASYGQRVRMVWITELDTSSVSYQESATSPIIEADQSTNWRSDKVHHIDHVINHKTGQPVFYVDGRKNSFNIGVFTLSGKPGFYTIASRTSAITLPNDSLVNVQVDTPRRDDTQDLDTSANTVSIPYSGWYRISYRGTFNGSTGVPFVAYLAPTSIPDPIEAKAHAAASGESVHVGTSVVRWLDAGDTVALRGYQNSGGNLDLQSDVELEIESL